MVTYTEEAAYRHRNRNRRVVVLEGTVEAADSADSVPLQPSNASLNSIDSVDFETTVVNGSILSYNATSDEVEFFAQDLTAQTTAATNDTFRAKVVGPEE